jgi:ribosomal protein S12 methylthiotransferase accessory factor
MSFRDMNHWLQALPFANAPLRFAPHLRPVIGPDRVLLQGEHGEYLLRGRVYVALAPLFDGTRTAEEIIRAISGQIPMPEIIYALGLLEERGYLAPAALGVAPERAAFWSTLEGTASPGPLEAGRVSVEVLGGEAPEALTQALLGAGLELTPEAPLRIVLTGDYLAPEFVALNRRALAEGFSWVPFKPSGVSPWLGPMFRPSGACWSCLAYRLQRQRPMATHLLRRGIEGTLSFPRAALPASLQAACGLAAVTLARWLASGGRGELDQHLLTLDLSDLQITRHAVTRRPQCPECGDPELFTQNAARPLSLVRRPRRVGQGGGHRVVSCEETFERFQHLVSPISGILTSLEPDRRDRPPRFVHGAFYTALPTGNSPALEEYYRAAGGKGASVEQARTSALCEGLERVSGLYQGDEPRLRARMDELGGEGVDPREILRFSETQYRTREAWNEAHSRRWHVPPPFVPEREMDWCPAWSLTRQRRRYLPMTHCYQDVPAPPEDRFCDFDTNGQASGNCLEEAILHGLLELVERDAVAIWWYNQLRKPGVELASFEDPYFEQLKLLYREEGRQLRVLELTSDLGIPVFAALADAPGDGLYAGFGCHLDAHLAVQRALTELNQVLDPAGRSPAPWDLRPLVDRSWLSPDEALPRRTRAHFPTPDEHGDLAEDVRTCVETLARAGLETLVVDQSRPDLGLAVVKVTVPGLRHIWPRFGPGRLYDVPVRSGWRDRALEEAALNPVLLLS